MYMVKPTGACGALNCSPVVSYREEGSMSSRPVRETVGLSKYPNLVVIYLGELLAPQRRRTR